MYLYFIIVLCHLCPSLLVGGTEGSAQTESASVGNLLSLVSQMTAVYSVVTMTMELYMLSCVALQTRPIALCFGSI
jgi:hypothetical protein